jgi:hypothetical protein
LQHSPDAETHYRVSIIILANSLAEVFVSLKFIKRNVRYQKINVVTHRVVQNEIQFNTLKPEETA